MPGRGPAPAGHLLGAPLDPLRPRAPGQDVPVPAEQSGFGKRLRRQDGLIAAAITALAREVPSSEADLRLVDSTPVPCETSRETVKRSALAGQSGHGWCRSHSRWFWGFRLYLPPTPEGMPVIWGLAPGVGKHEVTQALLERDRHLVRPGQIILGDKGFAGKDFEAFIAGLGAVLVRPDRRDESPRFGRLGRPHP